MSIEMIQAIVFCPKRELIVTEEEQVGGSHFERTVALAREVTTVGEVLYG